ncbi:hypothetical protein NMQ14_01115 [Methyloversatilis sp. XJ19-13]|uniref:hypothetical protein n=1 Tax=Methyloversatilis sp. XJ19-13 TaxID=2963430 RepID=UPI00211C7C1B|nr:hypothetical protein [Methyloversatilis sp. XJ19-13]MCQ9372843.1 hypothetical protein [Methyloversatilis sp. XJ19-13]
MGCYSAEVFIPIYDEFGNEVGNELFYSGCYASHADTISEAVSLRGTLDVSTTKCVTAVLDSEGYISFSCLDSVGVSFNSYLPYWPESGAVEYFGPHVASITGSANQFGSLPDYPQQKGSNMLCVTTGEGGALVVQNPQPANLSECGMVVLSGSEAMGNPFALSSEAGAAIAVAIITVWAVAFGCRAAIQTLFLKGSTNDESSA